MILNQSCPTSKPLGCTDTSSQPPRAVPYTLPTAALYIPPPPTTLHECDSPPPTAAQTLGHTASPPLRLGTIFTVTPCRHNLPSAPQHTAQTHSQSLCFVTLLPGTGAEVGSSSWRRERELGVSSYHFCDYNFKTYIVLHTYLSHPTLLNSYPAGAQLYSASSVDIYGLAYAEQNHNLGISAKSDVTTYIQFRHRRRKRI